MTVKKWTIARRAVQLTVIGLIASPLAGLGFFQGNLSSASLFGIDLADPLAVMQAGLAGRVFAPAFVGAGVLVAVAYLLLGGRTFCGWVCPVYLVSELGEKFRVRIGTGTRHYPRTGIRWAFTVTLVVSLLTGIPLFEIISPIGITTRAIMFTALLPLLLVSAILVVEVFVARRVWCRSLCPAGGFYSLLGCVSPLKIRFESDVCTHCGECTRVCPVEEVLNPCLVEGARSIASGDCTRCGACIDACSPGALGIGVGYRS